MKELSVQLGVCLTEQGGTSETTNWVCHCVVPENIHGLDTHPPPPPPPLTTEPIISFLESPCFFFFVLFCRSHLRQKLDKFVLITKKSIKFLSSVDQAKCDLLVSTWTKSCPWRQIFKGCHCRASEHDFLQTANKNCFSSDKTVSQFSEP